MPDTWRILPANYDIGNLPADKLEFLHHNKSNISLMRAECELVGYSRGVEKTRCPYDPILARKLGANLSPITVRVQEEGKLIRRTLGASSMIPELRMGYPPLKQLLLAKCGNGLTMDEIFKIVFKNLRYFPKNLETISWVRQAIRELLEEKMLVLRHDGKYFTGPFGPENLGNDGYPIVRGPYPLFKLIRDLAAEAGRISMMELEDAVHGEWGWTTDRSGVATFVKDSVDYHYIREVEEGIYEPLEEVQ